MLAALFFSIVVGTWNGNWFPSGRAEHRAHPAVEEATTIAAANMLAAGLKSVDPRGEHEIVLILNEIRNASVASNLIQRIGRKGLKLASISAYRRRDRFDQQQDVIATTLPIASADWVRWRSCGKETPPRGFARAQVIVEPALTASVYAVHLKSNYGAGKDEEAKRLNQAKRTHAVEEFVDIERGNVVIFAGDMNADKWRKEFSQERIFVLLENAGYLNHLALLPSTDRGTHPHKRYGDSALDYIFTRGFEAKSLPKIIPNNELSDHRALFTIIGR